MRLAGVSAVCDKPFDTTTIKQLIEISSINRHSRVRHAHVRL
jgi:hypothetical protein